MTFIDVLQQLNGSPVVVGTNAYLARLKRVVRPVAPIITRALIVCTFIEDGVRTLWEFKSQVNFFHVQLGLPRYLSLWLILISVLIGLSASALFVVPPTEAYGAKILMGVVVYQQMMYGRHSAITAGNAGFLIRNLCLLGTLALFLTVPKRAAEPCLPGAAARARRSMRDNCALAVRFLFGLAVLEMFDVVGWAWAFLMVPVSIMLLFGFQAEICALVLMVFYVTGTAIANPFWSIEASSVELEHVRELMRYEFLQSLSMLAGLFMMLMSGPGAFSIDNKLRQGKAY